MKKILLTGFGAYGNTKINPAEKLVKKLDNEIIEGALLISKVLPNNFFECIDIVKKLVDDSIKNNSRYDAILMFGEYIGRSMITIERIAQNLIDSKRYQIADSKNVEYLDKKTVPDGPAAYYSTLPLRAMVKAMRDIGVPSDISDNAGTFCCNHLMYGVLHFLNEQEIDIPAGWIHLPQLPEVAALNDNLGNPSISTETAIKGIYAAIKALLKYPNDTDDIIISNF